MAVTGQSAKPVATIRDFWRNYKKRATLIVATSQLLVVAVVALGLILLKVSVQSWQFWTVVGATALISLVTAQLMAAKLLQPLRDIAMAVTNAAGEQPTEKLANPNSQKFARNGFKPLLEFIYSINSASSKNRPGNQSTEPLVASALGTTSAGIVILNRNLEVLYANAAAPVVAGSDGAKTLSLLWESPDNLQSWLASAVDRDVRAHKTWRRVADSKVGTEGRRVFSISADYEAGSSAEVVITLFDASDIFLADDDDLDFISFAAHELRGPITVIRGYLDVLQRELEGQISGDQDLLFDRLAVSAGRLSSYVNNILNANKHDRRHLQIYLSEVAVGDIYQMIHDDIELRAESQNRHLSVNLPAGLPTVAADKSSISEVLSNLIDNAIKYSRDGGTIELSAEADGAFVKVSVTDHGIGIPPNVLPHVFDKFYRSHRSRETVAGTGIGLYICKAMIESHGGKIEASSIEGRGSVFSFWLPAYASVAEKLQSSNFSNQSLVNQQNNSITNHGKITG